MMKNWLTVGVCICVCGIGYLNHYINQENSRLKTNQIIYEAENRILKEEITTLTNKPNYDQGYKDALIRMGGPQQSGAYQDGWEAAMKINDGSYATGYHNAIQQFGYQKPNTDRWLIAESNIKKEEPITPQPVKK